VVLRSFTNRLDQLVGWLMRICRYCIIAITGWLTLILVISVFARFVFNYSLAWVDETSSLLLVWLMLTVAPLGFHENFHIALGLRTDTWPHGVRVVLGVVVNLATIAFFSMIAYFGSISTISDFSSQLFSLPVARGWATWVLPVSSIVIVLVCFRNLVVLMNDEPGDYLASKVPIR
jgi:TRAP-type C4-dicarboxylate transport system permease small subunit